MSTMAPVPNDHPIMKAWTAYKASPEFANTKHWASEKDHLDGSLWAVFMAGWNCRDGRKHSDPIEGV